MRQWIAVAAFALLAACGSTPEQTDNGSADNGNTPDKTYWREDSSKKPSPSVKKEPEATKPAPANPTKTEPAKPNTDTVAKPKPAPEPERTTKPITPTEPAKKEDLSVEKPKPEEPVKQPSANHDANVDAFIDASLKVCKTLEKSQAYVDYLAAVATFDKQYEAAKKLRDGDGKKRDAAWADAIRLWYEAKYMQTLFQHLNNRAPNFVARFVHERTDVAQLNDDELLSDDCRHTQAANELVSRKSSDLNAFRTDGIKYDAGCSKVYESAEGKKKFGDAQKKWESAAEGKFNEADLKKYRR